MREAGRGVYWQKAGWHKIGNVWQYVPGDRIPTFAEFCAAGAMTYDVLKEQAVRIGADGTVIQIPNQFNLVRNDDGKVISPSTVSSKYGVMQPKKIISLLEVMVEQGYAKPANAFTLYEGQTEVFSIQLRNPAGEFAPEHFDGDPTSKGWNVFFTMRNPHGGTGNVEGIVTGHRLDCHNMVTAAFAAGADFKIRHTSEVEANTAFAVQTWTKAQDHLARFRAALKKLSETTVAIPDTVEEIIGIRGLPADKISKQEITRRDDIVSYSRNTSLGHFGKTALDVYHGVTAYTTHSAVGKGGATAEERTESILGGSRGRLEARAWSVLSAMAGV